MQGGCPIRSETIVESTIDHENSKGFGEPNTVAQVFRKFESRICISIYRKFYGISHKNNLNK